MYVYVMRVLELWHGEPKDLESNKKIKG